MPFFWTCFLMIFNLRESRFCLNQENVDEMIGFQFSKKGRDENLEKIMNHLYFNKKKKLGDSLPIYSYNYLFSIT